MIAPLGPGSIVRAKWRLDALLAASAEVELFAATHRNSRRFVLKALRQAPSADPANVERFLGRGYAANQIQHPSIVRALDDDKTDDGRVFLVREVVDGETLAELLLREGPVLRPTHAVGLIDRLLEVLAEVHALGIVHGRIAAEHVLLGRQGELRLVGFRAPPNVAPAPDDAMVPFASPEHAARDAKALVPATDVYGAGALAALLLSGWAPSPDATKERLAALLPSLSEHITGVLERALASRPNARWETAKEMRSALEEGRDAAVRVKTGPMRAVPAPPSGPPPAAQRASRRMVVAIAVPIDPLPAASEAQREGLTAFLRSLDKPLGAVGLRAAALASRGALIVAPTASLAREEAFMVARGALRLRDDHVRAKVTILFADDLLEGGSDGDRFVAEALAATEDRREEDISIDPAVAFLLEGHFALGRERGLTTLVAEDKRGAAPRLLGAASACVGREREIASIGSALLRARADGRVRASVLVGPPGIGKSRVLHEAIERLRQADVGAEVWFAKADPLSGTVPLGMVRDLVRHACSVGAEDDAAAERRAIFERIRGERLEPVQALRIANDLASLSGEVAAEHTGDNPDLMEHEAAAQGDRVLVAFQDFVAAVAARRPLAIVLEDMQWADPATQLAMDRTLEHLHELGWLLIATARPEIDDVAPQLWAASGAVRVDLAPLGDAELEAVAMASIGRVASRDEVAGLVRAAHGNPLHLEERIRARADGAVVDPGSSLEAVVAARLDALSPDVRRTLMLASVFGSRFWFRATGHLVAGKLEGFRVGECLDELTRREMIVPSPRSRFGEDAEFAFRHGVIEAQAYAVLAPEERKLAHRRAGEWLERAGERDPAILAAHFARASSTTEAAAWHERSAALALGRNDMQGAIALAERGLAYEPTGDVALSLHAVLAESLGWQADYVRSTVHAQKIVDAAPVGSAMWCQGLAVLAIALGKRGERAAFVALAERALAVPPPVGHERAYASAIATFVSFALRFHLVVLVVALMERVKALEASKDPGVVAHALNARSWFAMFDGDFSACLAFDREVVMRFDLAGDLRSRCRETTSIGYDLMILGDYELAEKAFRAALAMSTRLGVTRVVFLAKQHLSPTALQLGRVPEAVRFAKEALEIAERGGDKFATANVRTYLAMALAARGDNPSAVHQLTLAVGEVADIPTGSVLPETELARIYLRAGDVESALVHATKAMDIVNATGPAEEGDAGVRLLHAEALRAAGKVGASAAAIASALERLKERAGRISDPALQRSFLERVPDHARTVRLADAWGVAGTKG